MPISDEDGRRAVLLGRRAIDHHVGMLPSPPEAGLGGVFLELRGAFVTINSRFPSGDRLRGCIGFPYPVKSLQDAIVEAAREAATGDPRFPPVSPQELDGVVVEVSILTPPTPLEAERRDELPAHVRIGTDGLMVSRSGNSGLLLPQVATEFNMGPAEFLSQACLKAGLASDAWLDPGTEVSVFQAEIFAEPSPRQPAHRVDLAGA